MSDVERVRLIDDGIRAASAGRWGLRQEALGDAIWRICWETGWTESRAKRALTESGV